MRKLLLPLFCILFILGAAACGNDKQKSDETGARQGAPAETRRQPPETDMRPESSSEKARPENGAVQEKVEPVPGTASGYGTPGTMESGEVSATDLLNRHFVLQTVNGKSAPGGERIPRLAFGEDFRITGFVCNRFTGQATLENDVLRVENMASTKMLCGDDALNQLETEFGKMMTKGARAGFDGKTLTLRGDGNVLTYALQNRDQI